TTGSGQIDRWDRAPDEGPPAAATSGGATPASNTSAPGGAAGSAATVPQPTVTPEASGAKGTAPAGSSSKPQ
ncbi:MAG TPA: hypothetical protein VGL86_18210, partial [Polyangia bacterium]